MDSAINFAKELHKYDLAAFHGAPWSVKQVQSLYNMLQAHVAYCKPVIPEPKRYARQWPEGSEYPDM
jgi:hypothetical protein